MNGRGTEGSHDKAGGLDEQRITEIYDEPIAGGLDEQEETTAPLEQIATERAHEDLVVQGDESDTILRTRMLEVRFPLGEKDRESIDKLQDMFNDMWEEGVAIGLAGNQAGVPLRAFVCCLNKEHRLFINPEIIGHSKGKKWKVEGCLSLPFVGVRIKRYKEVTLRYHNEDGEECVEQFRLAKHARIVQHELDHLNGILISDYYNGKKGNESNMGLHPQEEDLM